MGLGRCQKDQHKQSENSVVRKEISEGPQKVEQCGCHNLSLSE